MLPTGNAEVFQNAVTARHHEQHQQGGAGDTEYDADGPFAGQALVPGLKGDGVKGNASGLRKPISGVG